MNHFSPLTHHVIDFGVIDNDVDEVLATYQGFLRELDGILRAPDEIIDSSFGRTGTISDEILGFAKRVELEMIRVAKTPKNEFEKNYSEVLARNDVKMAFDLIMGEFVDRRNFLPERIKGDIDDTVGKLRNFLKHTLRDLVGQRMGLDESELPRLYVQLYFENLTIELKRTRDLLDLIIAVQGKFGKTNLSPLIFKKIRAVFEKMKTIAPDQWNRIQSVLGNVNRFFQTLIIDKKHLMRATDFFEFRKKVEAFSELSAEFISSHQAIVNQPRIFARSDVEPLIEITRHFEGILLDFSSFLEFMTYEVQKRECLSYKELYLVEAGNRPE